MGRREKRGRWRRGRATGMEARWDPEGRKRERVEEVMGCWVGGSSSQSSSSWASAREPRQGVAGAAERKTARAAWEERGGMRLSRSRGGQESGRVEGCSEADSRQRCGKGRAGRRTHDGQLLVALRRRRESAMGGGAAASGRTTSSRDAGGLRDGGEGTVGGVGQGGTTERCAAARNRQ